MPVKLPPLTETASRILLDGIVDYAGLFPPAALSMSQAVRNYAHYRASGAGWMLGRFVCAATDLELFSERADPLLPRDAGAIPWLLSVTGSGDLPADLAAIAAFNERHRVCFEECGAKVDVYEVKASSVDEIVRISASTPRHLVTYIEIPVNEQLDELVGTIARAGRRAKMRTGGTVAQAFPAARDIVRFLAACLAHDVPAKATAGLHHPLRGAYRLTYADDAPTGRMFGFLNVLLTAALLANGGSEAQAVALLEESRAEAFELNDLHVAWLGPDGVITFSRNVLQQVRERLLTSVGSCSFTEPVDESRVLGWI
jgi:hypothetical protein